MNSGAVVHIVDDDEAIREGLATLEKVSVRLYRGGAGTRPSA